MQFRFGPFLSACFAALVLAASLSAKADEFIQNGNFATGDLTDWTIVNNPGYLGVSPCYGTPTSNCAYMGSVIIGDYDSIAQTFATTPGATYNVSFAVANDSGAPGESDFKALWDGTPIQDVSGATSFDLTTYNLTETGTGSDTLTLEGYQVPAYYYVTDVSVSTASSPVPEPSGLWLVGTGLACLAFFSRRLARAPRGHRAAQLQVS